MNKMIVAVFDNENAAFNGLSSIKDLHRDGDLSLFATAVIAKDDEGNIETKQAASEEGKGTATGLLTGSLIGLIAGPGGLLVGASIGTLTGLLFDMRKAGIDIDFVNEVSEAMKPGRVAVLADIDEGWTIPLDSRISEQGGLLFRRLRAEVVEDQLDREMDATMSELEELEKEISESDENTKQKIKYQMKLLSMKVKTIQENADSRVNELKSDVQARVSAMEAQLQEAKESKKEKIEKRLTELQEQTDIRLAKLQASIERGQQYFAKGPEI